MIDEEQLSTMGFIKTGVLRATGNGQFEFVSQAPAGNIAPGVYLWLKRKDVHRHDVMYVGKAGSGIAIRMSQHRGGLKLAPAERVDRIKTAFGLGNCLEVWFRQSAEISLSPLFDKKISAYSTEEEALITRFSPQLNRAQTPSMRAEPKKAAKPQEGDSVFADMSYELTSANGSQRDLWEDALAGLTRSHKQKIGRILGLLSKCGGLLTQWPTLDCKVVGLYTAGPMCNQSMLVFGKLAKTNFKPNSKVVYVSLSKELIAFSPEVTEAMKTKPDIDGAYSLDACLEMLTQ